MKTTGLTLQEAIKSGRPFRNGSRSLPGPWYIHDPELGLIYFEGDKAKSYPINFTTDQLFSVDWEIKAAPREFWIIKNGDVCGGNIFESRDAIDAYFALKGLRQVITGDPDLDGREIIHVKEVLE